MEFILTTANLFFLFIIMAGVFSESGIIKLSVLAVTVFSLIYVIVSGLFFWIDKFSFVHVLGAMLALTVSTAIFVIQKKQMRCRKFFRQNTLPLLEILLIMITFLLSFQNFELFESGQDQGLYQAEAVELYMGNFEVEHDFEEYQILERAEDKQLYSKMLDTGIPGYYPFSTYKRIELEEKSDVSGVYHGIQTFPAIMALGGRLFGLENMMQIQTLFLICSVMLLYYALSNIGVSTFKKLGALMVFLLSPLVLWISKSAFTEMILTLCMSFYLFLLTEKSTRIKRLLSALPLLSFSFLHVSFLIIYPIFVLINDLIYLQSQKKEYLWVNVLTSLGLSAGYSMMAKISPQYFFNNVSRLYYKNFITANNFLYWVFLGCILVSASSLLLLRIKKINLVYQKIISISKIGPLSTLILLGVILVHSVIIGYFRTPDDGWRSELCTYYGEGFLNCFSHSSLFAFAMATGFFVILCILWYMVWHHSKIWSEPIEMAVYFLFLYCVLFQTAFIRKEVNYYYYYSRYSVFYIPIICIAFAVFFKQAKGSGPWAALILSVICMGVFDIPLLREEDQTSLEWETLQDLNMAIQDDSAIILDSRAVRLTGAFLRATTGEAIFPVMQDVRNEIQMLEKNYSNIYFLSSVSLTGEQVFDGMELEIVYKDKFMERQTTELEGHFPLNYAAALRELTLYRIKGQDHLDLSVFFSRVGELSDGSIIGTGESGFLLYGPYMPLADGTYHIVMKGEMLAGELNEESFFDVVNNKGSETVTRIQNLSQFVNGNQFELACNFETDRALNDCEFRVFVNKNVQVKIDQVTIEKSVEANP